jgi:hypothetical protein
LQLARFLEHADEGILSSLRQFDLFLDPVSLECGDHINEILTLQPTQKA